MSPLVIDMAPPSRPKSPLTIGTTKQRGRQSIQRTPSSSSSEHTYSDYPIRIPPEKQAKALDLYINLKMEEPLAQSSTASQHDGYLLAPGLSTTRSVSQTSSKRRGAPSTSVSAYDQVTDYSSVVSFDLSPTSAQATASQDAIPSNRCNPSLNSTLPVTGVLPSSNANPQCNEKVDLVCIHSRSGSRRSIWTSGQSRISQLHNTLPSPNYTDPQCKREMHTSECSPFSRGRRKRSFRDHAKNAAFITIAGGSTYIIHSFSPLRNDLPSASNREYMYWGQHLSDSTACFDGLGHWKEPTGSGRTLGLAMCKALEKIMSQILATFQNPSPPLTLAACVSLAFAITAFRHSFRDDTYQDHIIGFSILVGTAAASVSDDPIMAAKTLIPLSVIFALLSSALIPRVLCLLLGSCVEKTGGIQEEEI